MLAKVVSEMLAEVLAEVNCGKLLAIAKVVAELAPARSPLLRLEVAVADE